LTEVLTWHPRDLDTWLAMDAQDSQDARFAAMQRERRG
jgi:hypothetical protein